MPLTCSLYVMWTSPQWKKKATKKFKRRGKSEKEERWVQPSSTANCHLRAPVSTRQSPVSSGIPWTSHGTESDIDRERKYTHPLVGGPTKSYGRGHKHKKQNDKYSQPWEKIWLVPLDHMTMSSLNKCGWNGDGVIFHSVNMVDNDLIGIRTNKSSYSELDR